MTGEHAVRVLRAADRVAGAWRNGGGVTREIAAFPEGAGAGDFLWRVSLAEVAADGPFSSFPGVDRILTLAEGAGMDLTVAGVRQLVDERYVPQAFPGDEPTACRLLDGPVVNLNVMYRRTAVRARAAVVRGRPTLTAEPGESLLFVALAGPADLEAQHGPALALGAYDAVLATGPCSARVRTTGPAAVVRLAGAVSARGAAPA